MDFDELINNTDLNIDYYNNLIIDRNYDISINIMYYYYDYINKLNILCNTNKYKNYKNLILYLHNYIDYYTKLYHKDLNNVKYYAFKIIQKIIKCNTDVFIIPLYYIMSKKNNINIDKFVNASISYFNSFDIDKCIYLINNFINKIHLFHSDKL
jgi:hypothetical protein